MYFSHDELLQHEAADLLGDLFALYEFEEYDVFHDRQDLFYELASHVDERIGRRLLTLAALARVNDDVGAGLRKHGKDRPDGVGLIKEGGNAETMLTAREACNKIIHATGSRLTLHRFTRGIRSTSTSSIAITPACQSEGIFALCQALSEHDLSATADGTQQSISSRGCTPSCIGPRRSWRPEMSTTHAARRRKRSESRAEGQNRRNRPRGGIRNRPQSFRRQT